MYFVYSGWFRRTVRVATSWGTRPYRRAQIAIGVATTVVVTLVGGPVVWAHMPADGAAEHWPYRGLPTIDGPIDRRYLLT
jgi:hypothetical protein